MKFNRKTLLIISYQTDANGTKWRNIYLFPTPLNTSYGEPSVGVSMNADEMNYQEMNDTLDGGWPLHFREECS